MVIGWCLHGARKITTADIRRNFPANLLGPKLTWKHREPFGEACRRSLVRNCSQELVSRELAGHENSFRTMNDIPETCFSRIVEVKVIFFGRYQLQTTHFWWLHVRWWSLEIQKIHMFGGAETTRCAYQTVLLMYSMCMYIYIRTYIYICTHPYAYSINLTTSFSQMTIWLVVSTCFNYVDMEKPIDTGWWDDGAQILTVHLQYVGAYWAIMDQHNCLLHCTHLRYGGSASSWGRDLNAALASEIGLPWCEIQWFNVLWLKWPVFEVHTHIISCCSMKSLLLFCSLHMSFSSPHAVCVCVFDLFNLLFG